MTNNHTQELLSAIDVLDYDQQIEDYINADYPRAWQELEGWHAIYERFEQSKRLARLLKKTIGALRCCDGRSMG